MAVINETLKVRFEFLNTLGREWNRKWNRVVAVTLLEPTEIHLLDQVYNLIVDIQIRSGNNKEWILLYKYIKIYVHFCQWSKYRLLHGGLVCTIFIARSLRRIVKLKARLHNRGKVARVR